MAKILIVDDNLSFRAVLSETLASFNHEIFEAGSGEEALEAITDMTPHLVFLDLRMPGIGGLELLKKFRENPLFESIPVVILTAYADSANTIEAMKLGAFDHLTKPISRDDLKTIVTRAIGETANSVSTEDEIYEPNELLGASASFRQVQKLIGLAAINDTPVLITGETGTGKELVARAIHRHSNRENQSFSVIPCSSPTEGFENWRDLGTVYLEELADLEPMSQSRLLNLLKDASNSPRIIASSRNDLLGLVRQGEFRDELYYRLTVFPIALPPLRARNSDVLVLAEAFLQKLNPQKPKRLTSAAAKALLEHDWPGNVLELQNVISRAAIISRGPAIDTPDLFEAPLVIPQQLALGDLLQLEYHTAIATIEKLLLERALKNASGNRTEAARSLGIHRQLLYSKLKEHRLDEQ
jgi:two-component system, NtrC family, response regulator